MERVSTLNGIALREVPRDFLNRHIRRAAFRRFEELDKLAPDKKQLLKESPEK